MNKTEQYRYLLSGDKKDLSKIVSTAKGFSGVQSVELSEDVLTVNLDEHASEYEFFTALAGICEEHGVEVDYFEEANEKNEFSPIPINKEPAKEEPLEEEAEDEDEEGEKKDSNKLPEEEKPWKTRFILQFIEIGISALILILMQIFSIKGNTATFLYLIAFTVVGYEIVWDAINNIVKKNFINYNVPLVLAFILTVLLGLHEGAAFLTLVAQCVIVFGKVLTAIVEDKIKKRLYHSYHEFPDENGETRFAKDVAIDERLTLSENQVVPFDCVVVSGCGAVDNYNFSGIHSDIKVEAGAKIFGGAIVVSGNITVKVIETVENSFSGRLYKNMVAENTSSFAKKLLDKTKLITVINVIVALVVSFLLPAIFSKEGKTYADALNQYALLGAVYLVVSSTLSINVSYILSKISALYRALSMGAIVINDSNLFALSSKTRAIFESSSMIENNQLKQNAYGAVMEMKDAGVKTAILNADQEVFEEVSKVVRFEDASVNEAIKGFSEKGQNCFVVGKPNGDEADISFGDALELNGITIQSGELKTVAKTVKTAKRFAKSVRWIVAFAIVMKILAFAIELTLFFVAPKYTLFIALTIDAIASLICMARAYANGFEVY